MRLIDDVATTCVARGFASKKNLRAASSAGTYGHYMRLSRAAVYFFMSLDYWATLRETPLWLWVKEVQGTRWVAAPGLFDHLRSLEFEQPPRLLRDPAQNCPLVPLALPLGVERSTVIEDLVGQIRAIGELVNNGSDASKPGHEAEFTGHFPQGTTAGVAPHSTVDERVERGGG